MPAYQFHDRFADDVASGKKRSTIRARGKSKPPRVGAMLYLNALSGRKLRQAECLRVTPITIEPAKLRVNMVDAERRIWRDLEPHEVEQLAQRDGFAGADDFFAWFAERYGASMGGYLVEW